MMNVVFAHAPNTLPVIYDRGLIGVYHDWCESFGTYPRSYDLLHADHLFSRLKHRYEHVPVTDVLSSQHFLLIKSSFLYGKPNNGFIFNYGWSGSLVTRRETWLVVLLLFV